MVDGMTILIMLGSTGLLCGLAGYLIRVLQDELTGGEQSDDN